MVATDTVVGVAGAILLAAVMVGVFVYEYNNAPAEGRGNNAEDPTSRIAAFKAAYPSLGAEEDIDGDGNPNYNDTDLDGSGVADLDQSGNLVVRGQIDGTSANPPAPNIEQSKAFVIGMGGLSLHAELNYTPQVPPIATLPRVPTFELVLITYDGSEVTSGSSTVTGNQVTLTINLDSIPAGNYTAIVRQTQPGPATAFHANWAIQYGPVNRAT